MYGRESQKRWLINMGEHQIKTHSYTKILDLTLTFGTTLGLKFALVAIGFAFELKSDMGSHTVDPSAKWTFYLCWNDPWMMYAYEMSDARRKAYKTS